MIFLVFSHPFLISISSRLALASLGLCFACFGYTGVMLNSYTCYNYTAGWLPVPPVALRLDTYYYFNFVWLCELILTEEKPLLTLI